MCERLLEMTITLGSGLWTGAVRPMSINVESTQLQLLVRPASKLQRLRHTDGAVVQRLHQFI